MRCVIWHCIILAFQKFHVSFQMGVKPELIYLKCLYSMIVLAVSRYNAKNVSRDFHYFSSLTPDCPNFLYLIVTSVGQDNIRICPQSVKCCGYWPYLEVI